MSQRMRYTTADMAAAGVTRIVMTPSEDAGASMNCLICGKELNPQRSTRKYCSARCNTIAFKRRRAKCPKCGFEWQSGECEKEKGEE